jgi:hypothetical protein
MLLSSPGARAMSVTSCGCWMEWQDTPLGPQSPAGPGPAPAAGHGHHPRYAACWPPSSLWRSHASGQLRGANSIAVCMALDQDTAHVLGQRVCCQCAGRGMTLFWWTAVLDVTRRYVPPESPTWSPAAWFCSPARPWGRWPSALIVMGATAAGLLGQHDWQPVSIQAMRAYLPFGHSHLSL